MHQGRRRPEEGKLPDEKKLLRHELWLWLRALAASQKVN